MALSRISTLPAEIKGLIASFVPTYLTPEAAVRPSIAAGAPLWPPRGGRPRFPQVLVFYSLSSLVTNDFHAQGSDHDPPP